MTACSDTLSTFSTGKNKKGKKKERKAVRWQWGISVSVNIQNATSTKWLFIFVLASQMKADLTAMRGDLKKRGGGDWAKLRAENERASYSHTADPVRWKVNLMNISFWKQNTLAPSNPLKTPLYARRCNVAMTTTEVQRRHRHRHKHAGDRFQ